MRLRLLKRRQRMNRTRAGLLLSPCRKRPESKKGPEAPGSHTLLMQWKGRSATRREHHVHASRQISKVAGKRRYRDAIFIARERLVEVS